MNDIGKIGVFIQQLRKEKDMTQKELAAKLDVTDKIKKYTLIGMTVSYLTAVFVCLICDYCITGELGWSLIVICSLVFSWPLFLPFFAGKGKRVKKALCILTALVIPYLGVLGWCLKSTLVFQMGSCIAVLALIWLWCIYAVFCRMSARKLRVLGIFFLTAVPAVWGILKLVAVFVIQSGSHTVENILNTILLLVLAIACFGADYLAAHK